MPDCETRAGRAASALYRRGIARGRGGLLGGAAAGRLPETATPAWGKPTRPGGHEPFASWAERGTVGGGTGERVHDGRTAAG